MEEKRAGSKALVPVMATRGGSSDRSLGHALLKKKMVPIKLNLMELTQLYVIR